MRIQNNLMAMNTHRQLGINNLNQTKSTEKLSSGFRINRAADDASGLSISEKMRAQIRGLNQASSNAQDGISLVQAAEGALQESHSILQRMRELAVKAANDVNETEDRGAIKKEMDELTKEVDRIANTTEFNKKTLLDGSLSSKIFAKIGAGSSGMSGIGTESVTVPGSYSIANTTPAVSEKWTITLTDATAFANGQIKLTGLKGTATDDTYTVTASDHPGTAVQSTDSVGAALASFVNNLDGSLFTAAYDDTNNQLVLSAKSAGANTQAIAFADSGTSIVGTAAESVAGADAAFTVSATDVDGAAITGLTASFNSKTNILSVSDGTNTVMTAKVEDWTKFSGINVNVKQGSPLTLQVGANTGENQTIKIEVENLSAKGLGIEALDVTDHKKSQSSISAIEAAIQKVSDQRSGLGAVQNRLEHTVSNLDTVSENLQAAESRIRDVDMAKEMMAFTKNNILSQAATAMLAQANQAPQTVLQLLR